jgi:hypothetical protein
VQEGLVLDLEVVRGMGEDRRLAVDGSTNKEKRELTDSSSFLNRRRAFVKPLPAKGLGVGSPLCKIYFFVAAALPATISARFSAAQSLDTAAKMLNQMAIAESQSFESLRDRCSIGDAASDATTGAKESRRQRNLQCEKREDVRVTLESWRLSYISMYALGGAIQKSVRVPNTTKNYILPYDASTAMVAACCRPTSPKRVI